MPTNAFNVGQDCTVVLIGPYGRVDLNKVTNFRAAQQVKQVHVDPLNSPPLEAHLPAGWQGSFELDRADSTADDLASQIEQLYWTTGVIGTISIYQYVQEVDGSTSTYQFINGALHLANAGDWRQNSSIKQTINFWASTRYRV